MNQDVAVYVRNKEMLEQLQEAAQNTDFSLQDSPTIKKIQQDHFVICDIDTMIKKRDLLDIKKHLLYVISDKTDEENMGLIEKYSIEHLVGYNEKVFGHEIFNHLKKVRAGHIWGLKTYIDEESRIKVLSLSDSKFTNEMVNDVLQHFDFKDYFSSPIEYLQVMANELISNSLYKRPNRKRTEQGLDSVDRKSPVFLKGVDLVQVTLAMDAKGIALSVQDSFGGLSYDLLISSLKRSFLEKSPQDKKDGAGLGLYLTFLHSNQFIINYKENYRTEVICIIEKNKRYKSYKQRIRSFHFFKEVNSEKTNDQ